MKKFLILIILITMLMMMPHMSINAQAPYITQSPNRYGEYVRTQDAYEPVFDIRSFGNQQTFLEPKDLFIDEEGYLYVLDTGNKRIVIFDETFEYVIHYENSSFARPTGIFVRDNRIYIADYGLAEDVTSGRVHLLDFDKTNLEVNLVISYGRPDSPVLSINNFLYRPQKIAVDRNQTMYVVSEGSYNGILLVGPNNRFLSFYAPNRVQGTLLDRVIQILYGNNEAAQVTKKIPPAPTNLFLNDSGYVYTVTQTSLPGRRGDTLKKVNNGGLNFFPENMLTSQDFAAVTTGLVENVIAVTRSGFIYEYDREGNLLFIFGGSSQGQDRVGLFRNASGIAVNNNHDIIVLDDVNNNIHVLRPTAFADVVHQALFYYNQGRYVESQAYWEEVLRYNALFDLAHEGIGLSYMMQGRFEEAREKFEIANAQNEYSLAFWEVRNVWLLNYAGLIMVISLGLYLVLAGIKQFDKNELILGPVRKSFGKLGSISWVQELKFFGYYLKHPLDAFYEGKVRKHVSIKMSFLYLIGLIALYMMHLLFTGILFSPVIIERTVFIEELFKVLIPFITFVFANYLVSSLMEGEGTLRAIFTNTLGSLMPVYVILPIMILLSNVLTYNEQFIYYFGLSIMVGWVSILMFFNVKDTHNYTVKETIYNFIMTVLMMIVMIIIAIMMYMMLGQVVEFIADLVKEVIINA
jgi:tetratricopeptide (TPR) repeat protein